MKILVLANDDFSFFNFRKELLHKLVSLNNEVYISLPNGDKIKNLEEIGCKYIETEFNRKGMNPIKDIKLLQKYKKIIKEIKPDVVLTYTIKPNIYGGIACRKMKVPYIANITGLGTALENKSILQKILIIMYKYAFKNIKCCFTQNQENMNFVKKNILNDDRVKLLPGSGVNLEKFNLLDYPKKNDKIRFLFISRLMKEKGIEEYMELAKVITKKYDNIEFHVLGQCEKEYEEKLQELLNENILIYHGRQDNIIPFLEKASCLIHPSYYPEGISNVLLEASASGRPVITTNRSGCRDVVDDEKTGFIIEIKNTEQLIEKTEKFINLPYEEKVKMGLNARKKVEKEFDRNIVVNKYLEELEKLD